MVEIMQATNLFLMLILANANKTWKDLYTVVHTCTHAHETSLYLLNNILKETDFANGL